MIIGTYGQVSSTEDWEDPAKLEVLSVDLEWRES